MSCLAHTIQLVIKDGLKDDPTQNLLSKVRAIVRKVRSSSVVNEDLQKKSFKMLVNDCPTRWSSTHYMLRRLLSLRKEVTKLFTENGWDCMLTSEWNRVSDLTNLLQPFSDYTNLLQTDTMSLSNVIPSILELECHLDDTKANRVVTRQLLTSLRMRFSYLLREDDDKFQVLPAAASLLDPSVAHLLQNVPGLKHTAERFIIRKVCNYYLTQLYVTNLVPKNQSQSYSLTLTVLL